MTNIFPTAGECFTRYNIQYEREICKRLFETGNMLNCMRPVIVDHSYGVKSADITDGMIQAFQCDFTPKGTVEWDEHTFSLCKMKTDVDFSCENIEEWYDTAMADMLYDDTSAGAELWRYPRWVYEELIIPQIGEDLMQLRWSGERIDPVSGVPGTVLGACDGMCKHIQDLVDMGAITPIVTGALQKETILEQVEAFVRDIPYPYCMRPGFKVLVSPSVVDCYVLAWREKYGQAVGCCDNDNLTAQLFNTPYMLTGVRELEGTDTMIFVEPNNMVWGRRRGESIIPRIRWKEGECGRKLKGLMEFHRLYGIRKPQRFFINDQYKTVSEIGGWGTGNIPAPLIGNDKSRVGLLAA